MLPFSVISPEKLSACPEVTPLINESMTRLLIISASHIVFTIQERAFRNWIELDCVPSVSCLIIRFLPTPPFHLVTLNLAKHINQMRGVTHCFHRKSSLPPSVYLKGWEVGRGACQCIHTHVDVYIYTPHISIYTYVCKTICAHCSIWLSVKSWPLLPHSCVGSEFRARLARLPEEHMFLSNPLVLYPFFFFLQREL